MFHETSGTTARTLEFVINDMMKVNAFTMSDCLFAVHHRSGTFLRACKIEFIFSPIVLLFPIVSIRNSTEDIGLNETFAIGEDRDIGEAKGLLSFGVYPCIGKKIEYLKYADIGEPTGVTNRDGFIGERNDTLDAGEIQFGELGEPNALSCCVFERDCTIPAADEALGE